jgi:hypothetical protein
MSYYVKRSGGRLGYAFVGPIRSEKQAQKEVKAWQSAGHTAEILPSSPLTRAEVRAWTKQIKAPDGQFPTWPPNPAVYLRSTREDLA